MKVWYNRLMEKDFNVTLKNDYLFKRLLGAEENKAILQDFLEVVLNIPHGKIEDIEGIERVMRCLGGSPLKRSYIYQHINFVIAQANKWDYWRSSFLIE